jgi:hypothetical protein
MVGSAATLANTHLSNGAPTGQVCLRTAAVAKAWATDIRLGRTGLLDETKGMTHARDAARHALYTACKEGNIPDPLSRKAKRHG